MITFIIQYTKYIVNVIVKNSQSLKYVWMLQITKTALHEKLLLLVIKRVNTLLGTPKRVWINNIRGDQIDVFKILNGYENIDRK